ncbi:MAG: ComF family protein [Pseudomonadota bacterium]
MFAAFHYQHQIRDYLLQLKYGEATWVANCLCHSAGTPFFSHQTLPEALLPVPLHASRLKQRGFNQAIEIAATWSRIHDIALDVTALKRIRATPSQSGLDANQRRRNLKQAFTYSTNPGYRHVAIVDDVVTTGATADAITDLLHQAGVEFVEIWALARTVRLK